MKKDVKIEKKNFIETPSIVKRRKESLAPEEDKDQQPLSDLKPEIPTTEDIIEKS